MKVCEIIVVGKEALFFGKYDVVRINYVNFDMVGYIGDMVVIVVVCEECDVCVKEFFDFVEELGGMFLVIVDYGNVDDMVQRDKKGGVLKDDSGVFLVFILYIFVLVLVVIGGLVLFMGVKFCDDFLKVGFVNVTATYINFMGYEASVEMEFSFIV